MEEIWKDVIGFEGCYKVSNTGKVKSCKKLKRCFNKSGNYTYYTKEIILAPATERGYKRVRLQNKGKDEMRRVHRIVAQAFLVNLDNKREINHINGDKSDNNVNNLEWVTSLENIRHARAMGLYPKMVQSNWHKEKLRNINSKQVIDINTNIIYKSATDACNILGIKKSTLIHYLVGTRTNKTSLRYFN